MVSQIGRTVMFSVEGTSAQDTEIQRAALAGYGVPADRVYVDEGFTGTSTGRPGLDQALAAVHAGDTLIVPRLDRFARPVPDARSLAHLLIRRGPRLQFARAASPPADRCGKFFSNSPASFAGFEGDTSRPRTMGGRAGPRQR